MTTLKFKNPSDDLSSRKELVKEVQASNLDSNIKTTLIKDLTEDNFQKFMDDTSDPNVIAAIQAANQGGAGADLNA